MGVIKRGKIGVYGAKTRALQKRLSAEMFGLTFKDANVYMYLGSRANDNPDINDIQTKVFYEVPDRAYSVDPVNISISMEGFNESNMDFSRFGIINPLGDEQTFRVHVDEFTGCLGRPLIVGDVLEVPFFARECEKAFWEITDVDDKSEFEKFYVVITASVLGDSRKTREIPIDGAGNDSIMDSVMDEADQEYTDQVPYEGFDELDPDATPVDYRRDKQKSFLDDPEMIFNDNEGN